MKYCALFYCKAMQNCLCCADCPRLPICIKKGKDYCLNDPEICGMNRHKIIAHQEQSDKVTKIVP